jgi:Transglycosylase-like domain
MTNPTRIRRLFAAALMLTLLLTAAPSLMTAQARPQTTISRRVCDYDWRRTTHQLKKMIRCAARRWPVAGGPHKALSVARCESHFNADAYNPSGYAGVYQQATRYWPGRADTYGFRDYSVFNGRANIMVSVRMAHRHGWDPWSCA